MSRIVHVARLSRPIFLIVAGVLVGATVVTPVAARVTGRDNVTPATIVTYTRSVSCAGLDFYPTDSLTQYANDGTERYRIGGDGTGVFRCDPGLPNGAVVIKVQWTLGDTTTAASAGPCSLARSGLTAATAASVHNLASVGFTGVGAAQGITRLFDSSIAFATINNAQFGYWIECYLDPGLEIGLYGANVIYTISATKG